jgi:hypothetical protein
MSALCSVFSITDFGAMWCLNIYIYIYVCVCVCVCVCMYVCMCVCMWGVSCSSQKSSTLQLRTMTRLLQYALPYSTNASSEGLLVTEWRVLSMAYLLTDRETVHERNHLTCLLCVAPSIVLLQVEHQHAYSIFAEELPADVLTDTVGWLLCALYRKHCPPSVLTKYDELPAGNTSSAITDTGMHADCRHIFLVGGGGGGSM